MSDKFCSSCGKSMDLKCHVGCTSTRVLPGRESTKPYVVFTEVIRATKEWVEAAEVLRAKSIEVSRLHRAPMADQQVYVDMMKEEDAALAETRRIERDLMKRLVELVRGQTFTGLPK